MTPAHDRSLTEMVEQTITDLLDGLSVLVTGLPGSGRSHLVRAVTDELRAQGAVIISLSGDRVLADRPLSALVTAGFGVDPSQHSVGTMPLLATVTASLEASIERRSAIVIIDDASELDPASAGVIIGLRRRRDTPMLLVGDYFWPQADPLAKLISAAQPVVTVPVREKMFGEITQMADGILGGVTEASAVSRIIALSGGLPGVAEAIIRIGRRNGRLAVVDGVWQVVDDLWDDGLQSSLTPLLHGLDPKQIEDMAEIATPGTVPGHVPHSPSETHNCADSVAELMWRGLVRPDHTSTTGELYVYPPALGRLLRRLPTHDSPPREVHILEAGNKGNWLLAMTGLEAAVLANRTRVQWREDVARDWDRWEQDKSHRNSLPLLITLLSGVVDDERIAVVLDQTVGDDQDSYVRFRLLESTYQVIWNDNLRGALDELNRLCDLHPAYEMYLRGYAAHLTLIGDRVPSDELLRLPRSSEDITWDDMLLVARAESLTAQGDVRGAAELLNPLDPMTGGMPIIKQVLQGMVRVLDGDVSGGVEWATDHLKQAADRSDYRSIAGHAYVAALGMSMLGRFTELESMVEIVYRLSEMNGLMKYYKTGVFSIGAFVASWEDRQQYAQNLASQARALGAVAGPFPGMLNRLDQHLTTPAAASWDEIDDLLSRGYVANAVYLAMLAAESDPDPERARPVIRAGSACRARVLQAMTRYIDAYVDKDIDHFGEIVDELRAACGPVDATRGLISWALLARESGDILGWLDKAQAAWEEAGRIGRPCRGLFARLVTAVDLTGREAEISGYALSGQSAARTADAMGLSSRTVETHLQSVYRKTGASNRDELRQITNTWFAL
ncbi:MAG: LuxR C-terminal-related transcriptional regulator [Propionibacteriaceae bacterium]|jgi:DNA-binding CsgD family transcriptional regulator|nr:LuxR C-terminal-related transcriptional regulator [Propionibacteriaceae bacterium]